jgi:hypothetical protein
MVWEAIGSNVASRGEVIGYLDGIIKHVEDLTWLGITRVGNETDCDLVRADRPQSSKWPMSCRASVAQCAQGRFLAQNRAYLGAVLAACEANSEFDDGKMLARLRPLVAAENVESRGQWRCWRLADLLIALEARSAGRVLTSNVKHFAPICKVLGVQVVPYDSRRTR